MSFERLCAEIEQIKETYGQVLNNVYTKRKSPFPWRRYICCLVHLFAGQSLCIAVQ